MIIKTKREIITNENAHDFIRELSSKVGARIVSLYLKGDKISTGETCVVYVASIEYDVDENPPLEIGKESGWAAEDRCCGGSCGCGDEH